MGRATELAAARMLAEAAELARRSGPDPELRSRFVDQYWKRVSPRDVVDRTVGDLAGAALDHLALARNCPPDRPLVRVYTPSLTDDGWHTDHSVIDCVVADRPFVVDSVSAEIARHGYRVHLLAHPIMGVTRADGELVGLDPEGSRESLLHVEIDRLASTDDARALQSAIERVLVSVQLAVDDWQPMRTRCLQLAEELRAASGDDRHREAAELLEWFSHDRFIFLGFRTYRIDPDTGERVPLEGTGLGLLGDESTTAPRVSARSGGPVVATGQAPLRLTKSVEESPVHRAAPMDLLMIAGEPDETGRPTEHVIAGLMTQTVYRVRPTEIPMVRRTVQAVIDRADYRPGSHGATRLQAILEDHPRDELFQVTAEVLYDEAMAVLNLRERPTVLLLVRPDDLGQYVSCLVYVPRDRFNTNVRLRIQQLLIDIFGGTTSRFETQLSNAPHARLHVVVQTPDGATVPDDLDMVEMQITQITRTWQDDLRIALVDQLGEHDGLERLHIWQDAFDAGYREDTSPAAAVEDIQRIEELPPDGISVRLVEDFQGGADELRLRVYRRGPGLLLSEVLPVLKDLGAVVIEEQPARLAPAGFGEAWLYDFGLRLPTGTANDLGARRRFEYAFLAIWHGHAEGDDLGQLVLRAGLDWREVAALRSFRQYIRQIGGQFSVRYYDEVLLRRSDIARTIVRLYSLRFDPEAGDAAQLERVSDTLDEQLDSLTSLDEDRILRAFRSVVDAMVRTNFHQSAPDGGPPPHLVHKFDPSKLESVPRPIPAREIFVYSPRTEGVHLRMGLVARGGLRASDRREDFRTEVLGLAKAQAVKNAVIVPVGAKGGFVSKSPAVTDRAAARAVTVASYREFVGAMLDLTDNLIEGEVVPPSRVVRFDGNDPYLVVAADKGTADLSDTANQIALERGFWLGDAFASGGSNGYDHKEMGITARGAWESTKRHFFVLGTDPDRDPFTVVGIGDMSGDVFGNGMLLSRKIRLLAAFDHRHIFVDPDPDPETSWNERRRLFEKPGSSWDDYDRSLIAAGGGVFGRTVKSIALTPEMQAVLATEARQMTPPELISAVLRAPVDLLFNGGIGTYVKSSRETHADAADRTNDNVRVDASDLRCRVVVEGGNLGFTQPARVDFATRGGRINTDAIDNSGGVDCSDREVNIKILLNQVTAAGDLTQKQRNELLVEMTSEVTDQVLADNRAQNLTLAAARVDAPGMVDVHMRQLYWLERTSDLDREVEDLPSDAELLERTTREQGLTQPELAVLMSHTKLHLFDEILESDLPEDPAFSDELVDYFPKPIRDRFPAAIDSHPLRRELLATIVTNRLVNLAGISMTHRLMEETAANVADIVRAHAAAWSAFDLGPLWSAVGDCTTWTSEVQTSAVLDIKKLAERSTRWFVRNRAGSLDPERLADEFNEGLSEVWQLLSEVASESDLSRMARREKELATGTLDDEANARLSSLFLVIAGLDLVDIARQQARPIPQVATAHFALDGPLHLAWLRQSITRLPREDRWEALARSALRDDFYQAHRRLTELVLLGVPVDQSATEAVEKWLETNDGIVSRATSVIREVRASPSVGLAQLSVALRELRNLGKQTVAAG